MKGKTKACIYCGKVSDNLSVRKICRECAVERMRESAKQIREKKGVFYDKYKHNILAKLMESE